MTICLIFKHEVAINRRNNLILLLALELVNSLFWYSGKEIVDQQEKFSVVFIALLVMEYRFYFKQLSGCSNEQRIKKK